MRVTPALLVAAVGCTAAKAAEFAPHLAGACTAYQIDTPRRLAAFLAQIGHESGSLKYTTEIWGPTAAQQTYEGRISLGNTEPGDGERYKGHGLIQTTGRFNHRAVRDRLRKRGIDCPDFEAEPDRLAEPAWAAWSAADYWDWRHCNPLADAGSFEAITIKINGGTNGQSDRLERWAKAKAVLENWVEDAAAPIIESLAPTPAPVPDPTQYSQEAGMPLPAIPAIVSALLPTVVQMIPRLATIFKPGSEVAERNVAAASAVIDIVTQATGAVNAQAAVEAIKTDPTALAAATKAVESNWFELHKATEESVAAARLFNKSYVENMNVRTVAWNFTFLEVLSLILVLSTLSGGMSVLLWGGIDDQLKGAVVTLMLIGGFTGVTNFWFGSSLGSKKKDDK